MAENFGTLLKSWRSRRRMSQLDLGLAADVSPRHISFLETGRARPSRQMVLQLSESLEVPRESRNTLLTAAGFARAYRARSLDDAGMSEMRAAIEWMLGRHDPFPAIAFDRHWRLVRTNECATALLEPLGLGEGASLLEAFISGGPFTQALENREEVARLMVSRLRTESAHLGGDPVLADAADRIAATLADGAPRPGTMPAVIPARYNVNGMTLSLLSTVAQFGTTEDIILADLRIELMFPADDRTRAALLDRASEEQTA